MLKIKARQVPRFLKLEFVGGVVGTDGAPRAHALFAVSWLFTGWPVVIGSCAERFFANGTVVLRKIG